MPYFIYVVLGWGYGGSRIKGRLVVSTLTLKRRVAGSNPGCTKNSSTITKVKLFWKVLTSVIECLRSVLEYIMKICGKVPKVENEMFIET